MEVARQGRPRPVQRPAAAARNGRQRHPLPAERGDEARLADAARHRIAAPPSAAVAAASAATPRTGDPELEAKRKKAEADAAAKNKAEQEKIAALKVDNCSRARAQMTTLKSGIRLAQTNAKTGEREFMDDKQRADETRRVQDVITNDCK